MKPTHSKTRFSAQTKSQSDLETLGAQEEGLKMLFWALSVTITGARLKLAQEEAFTERKQQGNLRIRWEEASGEPTEG